MSNRDAERLLALTARLPEPRASPTSVRATCTALGAERYADLVRLAAADAEGDLAQRSPKCWPLPSWQLKRLPVGGDDFWPGRRRGAARRRFSPWRSRAVDRLCS